MHIRFGVSRLLMVPVVRGPPQGSPLGDAGFQDGEAKLPEAISSKGPVRKVPVIEGGDGEHSEEIQTYRHPHGGPAPPHPDNPQADEMHQEIIFITQQFLQGVAAGETSRGTLESNQWRRERRILVGRQCFVKWCMGPEKEQFRACDLTPAIGPELPPHRRLPRR